MLKEKTPQPEWANPYVPRWTGSEWIVEFADRESALQGCALMRAGDNPRAPLLTYRPMPDGNGWYVCAV